MRFLYFHQHFTLPTGVGGVRSYKMAKALVEAGHQVVMVCGRHDGCVSGLTGSFEGGMRRGQVHGIEIVEFDLPYSNSDGLFRRAMIFFQFATRCTAIALFERFDVVFATTTPLTVGVPGILARIVRRTPFVFEVRDLWPELPRAMGVVRNPLILWAMSALEWASYRAADRLIALSGGIAEGIARHGVSKSLIATIPNGCDLDIFTGQTGSWRPEGVGPGDLLCLFAGTHGVANGLDAVLDAAAEVKKRGRKDIKLVLIGNGKCKPALMERAACEWIDNVVFLDPVPKDKLAGLMAASDLGLQILANVPSFFYGTSPNKFFDYIAAGMPVLNNYPGWLATMIEDHGCGFAILPDDPVSFANALEQAADDREALREMGMAARALATQSFDRANLAAQFVAWVSGAATRGSEHDTVN